jgi:putative flippase GtrA
MVVDLAKFFRFVISGVLAAVVYYGVALLQVRFLNWSVLQAGAVAYLVSMPVAFLLHKWFTFGLRGGSGSQVRRFTVSSITGIALSSAVPELLVAYRMPLEWALALTCVVVPVASYVLLSSWVFIGQASRG